MAEKNFLDRAAELAWAELDKVGGDAAKTEIPIQTVILIYSLQPKIDNGGFQYLFENDLPFSLPYSALSAAYRRIGATKAADLLERSVAMFPFENPHLYSDKRIAFMETLDEEGAFFANGDELCGDKSVWEALEKYARAHPEYFQRM